MQFITSSELSLNIVLYYSQDSHYHLPPIKQKVNGVRGKVRKDTKGRFTDFL